MRLVDEVVEELAGADPRGIAPIGQAIADLLGGPRGTLADLAEQFTRAGLGHVMASWIGNGPNEPIAPDQLRRVLGDERVRDFATLTGLPEDGFLARLAAHLPGVIDRMTPEGHVQQRENRGTLPA
jgi:uncharacterized protein YidB (DUF937 family)